ncbi:MAG: hypothetical protein E5W19_10240, partial [Mesorhizobium sp.]
YSDGERGAVVAGFANRRRCRKSAGTAGSLFLPVAIRGEVPGRAMRGSADFNDCRSRPQVGPKWLLHRIRGLAKAWEFS